MRLGTWIYALATIILGISTIASRSFDPTHQPVSSLGHIPALAFLACVAGVALIACGVAILVPRTMRAGAIGATALYVSFALLWLPRMQAVVQKFGLHLGVVIFILGGIAQQLLLAAPGLLLLTTSGGLNLSQQREAATVARWLLGAGPILFGLGHLISAEVIARFVPHWVPFAMFFTVLTGIAFFLSGVVMILKIKDVLAARLLAVMLLLFEFIVEAPPVFSQVHSQTAWGGAIYNVAAIGAYWLFAEYLALRSAGTLQEPGTAVIPQGLVPSR